MACCLFFGRKWRSCVSPTRRVGYHPLRGREEDGEGRSVTVVVGDEKRVFEVDSFVLEKDPFRTLLGKTRRKRMGGDGAAIFIRVDAILFEHMLWLMQNDRSSFLQLNVGEIIDFYAQDSSN